MTGASCAVHRALFCSADDDFCPAGGSICSVDGSICCFDGFPGPIGAFLRSVDDSNGPVDGLICSRDGFLCSADGFIYSVEARNWWIDSTSSMDAVNIASRRVLKTDGEAVICYIGVKLTVTGHEKCSFLPNFVADSAPSSTKGARNIVDRANKTISGRRMCPNSGANCPTGGRAGAVAPSVTYPAESWSTIGRTPAKCLKSSSVVKIEYPLRAAMAQIRKSVFEPWIPFP